MAEAKRVTKAVTEPFKAVTDTAVQAATEAFQHSADSFSTAAQTAQAAARPGMPSFEFPTALRDLADKGVAQAKQNYERAKAAVDDAGELVESTVMTAYKGISEYNLKLLETLRANINAHFDFTRDFLAVKTPSEAVELSSAHARKSFEAMSAQSKELATIAQKVSTETAEPIKAGFNKALRVVS